MPETITRHQNNFHLVSEGFNRWLQDFILVQSTEVDSLVQSYV